MGWPALYGMNGTDTSIFYYVPEIFLFPISPAQWSIKKYFKPLFYIIRSSTKTIELDHVKCLASPSEDRIWKEFLEIDSNIMFSKKWVLQKRKFPYSFLHSISYNNMVIMKQVYFSPIFRKSWAHVSNNIAGVEGGPQHN